MKHEHTAKTTTVTTTTTTSTTSTTTTTTPLTTTITTIISRLNTSLHSYLLSIFPWHTTTTTTTTTTTSSSSSSSFQSLCNLSSSSSLPLWLPAKKSSLITNYQTRSREISLLFSSPPFAPHSFSLAHQSPQRRKRGAGGCRRGSGGGETLADWFSLLLCPAPSSVDQPMRFEML